MKIILYGILSLSLFFVIACNSGSSSKNRIIGLGNPPEETNSSDSIFDFQGHRGARGLLPENSIPAFLKAVDLGVKTIELDVVVSRDEHMIVSHEPFFSHSICKNAQGDSIAESEEKNFNLYQYTAAEIRQFDCGSLGNPNFPKQKKLKVYKPTLKEAIKAIEAYRDSLRLRKIFYNIETKSSPEGDSIYHPKPQKFAELLYKELQELNILDRVFIQSFDVRTLQAFKELNEEIPLVLLVYNELSLEENIQKLGFTPSVYSPFYERLTPEELKQAHNMGMKVIPWTVNDLKDMIRLQKMGVDGLISDYPDLFAKLR